MDYPRRIFFARRIVPFYFLLPCIIFLVVITIYPLIYSLYLSFHTWQLGLGAREIFVGISNYKRAFYDARLLESLLHTLHILVVSLGVELLLGLAIAMLLMEEFRGRKITRAITTTPMMLVPIGIGYMWRLLFHEFAGPIDHILVSLGLPRVQWLSSVKMAIWSIIIVDIWQWTPFVAMLCLAGLQSLPKEPFEAATIDGASRFRCFTLIALPLMKPVLLVVILIRFIDIFKVFDTIYVLTGGGPGSATETCSYYAYVIGFKTFQVGYAASISYLLLILIILLSTVLINFLMKEQ